MEPARASSTQERTLNSRLSESLHSSDLKSRFMNGEYAALSEDFYAGRYTSLPLQEQFYILCSLARLGKVDASIALWSKLRPKSFLKGHCVDKQSEWQVESESLFFITIGLVRSNQLDLAREYIAELKNLFQSTGNLYAEFYYHQVVGFTHYFTGNYSESKVFSKSALVASMKSDFTYGMYLSSDLFGHTLLQLGNVYKGIEYLKDAHKFAVQLGSKRSKNASLINIELAKSEFWLAEKGHIASLKRCLNLYCEDNYSRSTVLLEIASQLILKGRYAEAKKTLLEVSQIAEESNNNRHLIRYYHKMAYLSFLMGEISHSLSLIQAGQKLLTVHDNDMKIRYLGLSLKIKKHLYKPALFEIESENDQRQIVAYKDRKINQNICERAKWIERQNVDQSDYLGKIFGLAQKGDLASLAVIERNGLLTLYREILQLDPTKITIVFNIQKSHCLLASSQGMRVVKKSYDQTMIKLMQFLSEKPRDRAEIVNFLWGFEYNPLRHDKLIFPLISKIRKFLAENKRLLKSTQSSYFIGEDVEIKEFSSCLRNIYQQNVTLSSSEGSQKLSKNDMNETNIMPAAVPSAAVPTKSSFDSLNYRQINLLKQLKVDEWVDVKDYQKRMTVSKATATRDLTQLVKHGFIRSFGKAKATKYKVIEIHNRRN